MIVHHISKPQEIEAANGTDTDNEAVNNWSKPAPSRVNPRTCQPGVGSAKLSITRGFASDEDWCETMPRRGVAKSRNEGNIYHDATTRVTRPCRTKVDSHASRRRLARRTMRPIARRCDSQNTSLKFESVEPKPNCLHNPRRSCWYRPLTDLSP